MHVAPLRSASLVCCVECRCHLCSACDQRYRSILPGTLDHLRHRFSLDASQLEILSPYHSEEAELLRLELKCSCNNNPVLTLAKLKLVSLGNIVSVEAAYRRCPGLAESALACHLVNCGWFPLRAAPADHCL